jgi:hypothetical protein
MALTDIIESSLKSIETMLGSKTFTWDGDSYKCHVGNLNESAELVAGGYAASANKLLIVRKSEFTDGIYPVEKTDYITFNSKTYLIDSILEDATETFLQFVLGAPNKRK